MLNYQSFVTGTYLYQTEELCLRLEKKAKVKDSYVITPRFFFFPVILFFLLASVLICFRFSLSGGNVLCYVEK